MMRQSVREFFGGAVSKWDWLLFALVAITSYVTFQHADLAATVRVSVGYLQGHALDFYEYNQRVFYLPPYLPSTYLVFALWNAPLRLLGILDPEGLNSSRFVVLMWSKLLIVLFYLGCAVVVYALARKIGLGDRRSQIATFAWITTPIAMYGAFMFGQYDSFSVFLILLGVYFLFKDDFSLFALLLGLAFTFKYFSLFFFVPLLLLREKRFLTILWRSVVFAAPTLIELAVYLPSRAFREGVSGNHAAQYLWKTSLSTGYFELQLVPLLFVVLCVWAYFTEASSTAQQQRWSLFFSNVVIFLLFGLSLFHPQWLLLATPFWVLGAFTNKKTTAFLALDILLMLFFVLFSVTFHDRDVDQHLFGLGIFGAIAEPVLPRVTPMRDLLHLGDPSLPFSVFSALLLASAVFKHPSFALVRPWRAPAPAPGLLRARLLAGVAIFAVPATMSLLLAISSTPPFFLTAKGEYFPIGAMVDGREVRQTFVAAVPTITRIDFLPGILDDMGGARLEVRLLEPATDTLVYKTDVAVATLNNREFHSIRLPSVHILPGQRYVLAFRLSDDKGEGYFTLYRTAIDEPSLAHHAVIDGERKPFDLVLRIYGR